MTETVEIAHYDSYVKGMKKSLEDKLFFEKWLGDVEHLVDFGCADGELLKALRYEHPNLKLSGIDMNEIMLKKANVPNCSLITSDMPKDPKLKSNVTSALNLSSVLHEVYSYGSADYINRFWRTVNEEKYDYVYIRDMMYEDLLPKKGLAEWHSKLIRYGDVKQMSEFQRHNGYFLGNKKNMVHFLLKYRYLQNWEREVRENYFSYSLNDVMEGLEDYDCIHYERYALPFLRGVIKKDFDIDFNEMTHVKMVFRHR